MTMHEIEEKNYEHEVIKSERPVVVYFWAPWCRFCSRMTPVFEKVAKEFEGNVKFGEINIDHNEELAKQNNLKGIPCIILYNGGRETGRIMGVEEESVLLEKIATHLKDFY